ncbi:non-ribosomal peptide synthetase, partial [Paenibacillus tarimensis]
MAVMKLEKTNVEDILPLTPIQQGMLFHYLSEPWSGHYIEQLSLSLAGDINVTRLKEAWQSVCMNNEMLRTVFRWEGLDNPVQIVLKSKELQVAVHDCTMHSGEQQEQAVREIKEADLAQKFDLRHEVIRINVCLTGRESCELILSNHHIIYDGWSTGILLREFLDCYDRLAAGLAPERPANKSSFKQYVQWLGRQDKEAGLRYWRKETAGQDSLSLLPQEPGMKSTAGADEGGYAAAYVFDCAGLLAEPVEQWAARHEVTAAAVFYTVWGLLLSRYNRQHEVLFGTTVSGRSGEIPGMEQSVGLYINTLPLRVSCEAGDTLLDVVKRVHNRLIERQEYEYVALQDIMADRKESGGELFQSLVVMENYPLDRVLNTAGRAVRIASYQMHERTHYDFTVQITAFGGEEPVVQFTYNEALFSSRTAVRIAGHFRHVLRQLTEGPQLEVSLLEIVPEEEKTRLLQEFSFGGRTDCIEEGAVSAAPCLHTGLEVQAARLEGRTALVHDGGSLTYGEVNRRANQLARKLQGLGITRGTVAAVRMHRSPEMIIGLLAILKAGAAYLPILPEFPAERAAYMLEDSGASLVLTHRMASGESTAALPEDIRVLCLDDQALYEGDSSDPGAPVKGEDLAYIIYTSGSTGLPKGVAVEHRSALNTLQAMQRICPLGEEDTYLLKTTFTFDVSVCELFGWFFGGGRLAILEPEGEKEPARWMAAIRYYGVTHVNFVPSLLAFMMQELPDQQLEDLRSLRYVMAAGEALKPSLAEAVHTRLPHVRLFNLYGPTEAAIYATWHEVERGGLRASSVPIGRPVDNMHIYILDHEGMLCPEGVLGELCIAGVGVARGYLNRDDLTAERFMIDPVGQAGRMYRTGDLARWLPDGTIEYGGRTDYQVKVRGYRIEPGEIEACLAAHPLVSEAVVIHRINSQGEAYLCAFFTAEQPLDTAELRAYASRELPAYMLPAYLEQLPELPLTPSGKIDRKALPEVVLQPGSSSGYEAPVTDVQGILVQVWEEVLATTGIGIGHSFIELGGDSIKAMKVASRLMKYGYQTEIKHILLHPTIRNLSPHVTRIRQQASQKAEEGIVKLTPIQELFFRQVRTDRHHFNQSFMLHAEERLDISCLRGALDELTRHHDALRMVFRIHDGRVEQMNRPVESGGCDFAVVSLIGSPEAEAQMTMLADECQASMNLENGPLMKARLFQTDRGDHLLLVIHHLVVDGVSWRIIMEDLAAAYMQLVTGKAVDLGQRTASFRQWSESLHAYAASERLAAEADYWRIVEGTPVQPLPFVDRTAGGASNRMGDTRMLTTTLTEKLTSSLLHDVHAAYHTQVEDYLLAALGSAFKRVTGLDRLLLHLEGHGRQEVIQEQPVLRTVGWFTSIYPVILELSGLDYDRYEEALPGHIRQVKESLRRIPHKGIGYGVLKYLSPPELREKVPFRLQPEVSFNYLGQFDDDLRQGPFAMSQVSPGREASSKLERQAVLEIYGMVKGGCLELNWMYNKHLVPEEVMQELSGRYLQELQMMIEHGQAVKQARRTPSDYPYAALSMAELDALTDHLRGRQQELINLYRLSPLQEGLLFHERLDPDSSAYVQQIALRVAGTPDVQRLDRALQELFARYEALRTQIIYEQVSKPHQAVLEQLVSPVRVMDLRSLPEELEQDHAIADYMKADRIQGFRLDGDPLLRVTVFLLRDDSWHLLWTYHHIIMDGWCAASLFKQLFALYRNGDKSDLEPAAPYGRYMEWLDGRNREEAHRFWSGYLAGYEGRAGFPRSSAAPSSYEPGELQLLLSAELTRRMEETARCHDTTLYTVFQAAWAIMLQRYSASGDVIFGSVVSGRSPEVEGIEHMAGLFINTVPVRVRAEEGDRFCDLLDRLRRMNAEASAYEYCPLAEIQSLADVKQGLVNHLLIFENYPLDMEAIQGTGAEEQLVIQDIQVVEQTSYDLDVTVIPDEHLQVKFGFNRQVYDQQLVEQLAAHLQYIAEQVTASPDMAVHAIELMTEEEKKRLAVSFNATDAELPQKTVHELFEAQAARLPEAAAVLFGKERISYAVLNKRANRLARYLLAQGAGKEELVAIVMDRSPDMLTAILAIWKAGGAYVPVDPGYPAARQQTIIRESGVRFLIGDSESVGGLGAEILSMRLILLDLEEAEIAREPEANIGLQIKPSQLAYVIYTSGSTGRPKGTMIEHAGMLNHILAEIEELDIKEGTVLAQNASHC